MCPLKEWAPGWVNEYPAQLQVQLRFTGPTFARYPFARVRVPGASSLQQASNRHTTPFQLLQPRSYSMHHCLQIQELLSLIFRHYAHKPKMLVGLAMTCKAFQEPSLDFLWHTQTTLLPLLKCLPPNAWVIKEGKFVSHISQDKTASFSYPIMTTEYHQEFDHV